MSPAQDCFAQADAEWMRMVPVKIDAPRVMHLTTLYIIAPGNETQESYKPPPDVAGSCGNMCRRTGKLPGDDRQTHKTPCSQGCLTCSTSSCVRCQACRANRTRHAHLMRGAPSSKVPGRGKTGDRVTGWLRFGI